MLRRIIRRAVRHAYLLGARELVTPALVDAVDRGRWATRTPSSQRNRDCHRERRRPRGGALPRDAADAASTLLDEELDELAADGAQRRRRVLPARHARLPDRPHQRDRGRARPRRRHRRASTRAMAEQRRRGQGRAAKAGARSDGGRRRCTASCSTQFGPTEFTGREEYETKARVLAVLPTATTATTVEVVLDRTPFYAESGGQVGDTGTITHRHRRALEVLDTQYALPGLRRHTARGRRRRDRSPDRRRGRGRDRRRAPRPRSAATTPARTSCTGRCARCSAPHVKQAGSLVAPDRLRFDFSHYEPVTPEQLARDRGPRERTRSSPNAPVRHYETTKAEAEALGAIAFFGDKYGDIVRVLEAGPHSIELCGGTHVHALGFIGPIKIVSEGSIGSNLRRIEAITGTATIERLRHDEDVLAEAASLLGVQARRAGRGRHPPARRGEGAARRAQVAPPAGGGIDAADLAQSGGRRHRRRSARRHRRATSCASSRSRSASSRASARWSSAARPRAAARRWSRRSRATAASTRAR